MRDLTKIEVMKIIGNYFSKDKLDTKQTKKIKKLAMSYRISLREHRKRFCKKCYSDLKIGKVRISVRYKQISCKYCGIINRWKIR